MKEKSTYEFPVKIIIYTDLYVTSDSVDKAEKFLNGINPMEVLNFMKESDIEYSSDLKITGCTEYCYGNIAEEYIIADTEDYEDYDEDI